MSAAQTDARLSDAGGRHSPDRTSCRPAMKRRIAGTPLAGNRSKATEFVKGSFIQKRDSPRIRRGRCPVPLRQEMSMSSDWTSSDEIDQPHLAGSGALRAALMFGAGAIVLALLVAPFAD